MPVPPLGVAALTARLGELGWIAAVLVGGSAATGDHVQGVSDLDLVAVTDGPVDDDRRAALVAIHTGLDRGGASGCRLGCVYVDAARRADPAAAHPTWTHGGLVDRILSGVSRAELVRHGYATLGPPPQELFPPMTDDDLRRAAHAELTGYWAAAAARPWWWLDPAIAELGLTAMARGRHTLATGTLLTKTAAIDQAAAPPWLIGQLRDRRAGGAVTSPRVRTAFFAWRDARRTTAAARRWTPPD